MKICLTVRLPINPSGPNDSNNSTGSLLPTHLHLQLQDVDEGSSRNHTPIVDIGLAGISYPNTHLGYSCGCFPLLGENRAQHLLPHRTDRHVGLPMDVGRYLPRYCIGLHVLQMQDATESPGFPLG